MTRAQVRIPKQALAEFCRNHGIRKLSLFGSVLRDDFTSESDIDVLVEFAPDRTVGLQLIDLEEELSELFGGAHKVNMVSPKYLNQRIRERILASAQVLYAVG